MGFVLYLPVMDSLESIVPDNFPDKFDWVVYVVVEKEES